MWLPPRALLAVGSPLDLAVLRIVVPFVVLGTPELRDAAHHVAFAHELRIVPLGFETALHLVPPTPTSVTVTQTLLIASCLLAMTGLFARASLALATMTAFYGLGLAQLHGTVTHNHHLVWLLGLLAASPCADVLSIDALWKRRKGGPSIPLDAAPTPAHSLSIIVAWSLIAVIYFFPGFWKLRSSGLDWITSDNLQYQMYWKWYQTGNVPFFRLDRLPVLCHALALIAVLFELTFGALVFFRRTRPIAIFGALCFHAFTYVFMHIRYPSLWMCYVMFIDWRAVLRFMTDEPSAPKSTDAPSPMRWTPLFPVLFVGSFLLGGSIYFGANGIQRAWPFACYPTFEWHAAKTIPRLRLELVFGSGRIEELELPREPSANRSQQQWGMVWSLAGVTDAPNPARLRALVDDLEKRPDIAHRLKRASAVRIYRAFHSVLPDAWNNPPTKKVLLAELPLDPTQTTR